MLTAWLGIYMFVVSLIIGSVDVEVSAFLALTGLCIMVYANRDGRALLLVGGGLFLLRIVFSVTFHEYRAGDQIGFTTYGKRIERIEGRYPVGTVYTDAGEDRIRYTGRGVIREVVSEGGFTFYKMEVTQRRRVEDGVFRRKLKERIDHLTRGYSRGLRGFYEGVIAGEKEEIDDEVKERFSYTGTSHLIVISGLHIGVIIALILYLTGRLPVGRGMRYSVTMVMLSIYVAAVWGSPSVVRAYIMGMCYLLAGYLYEEPDIRKSYFAAMIVNLFISPLGALSVSFQMSYMAVFSILFIYPMAEERVKGYGLTGWRKAVVDMALLSLLIQIMLTPIFVSNFRSIPVFSFLVNIVAIPLGVVFVQGAFLALILSFVGAGGLLMPTVNLLYLLLVGLVQWTSELPLLSLDYRGVSAGYMMILMYLFIGAIFHRSSRRLSLIPLMAVLAINTERYSPFAGKGMTYYPYGRGVIVTERKLGERDLDYLWDNRIRGGELLISSRYQDKDIMRKLEIKDVIILEKDQEVDVGSMRFKNIEDEVIPIK